MAEEAGVFESSQGLSRPTNHLGSGGLRAAQGLYIPWHTGPAIHDDVIHLCVPFL